jgi:hypothetical protein
VVNNLTNINLITTKNDPKRQKKINLNLAFNDIIEIFCKILVLYQELFVVSSDQGSEQNPIFLKSSVLDKVERKSKDRNDEGIDENVIKSWFNNDIQNIDYEKCKQVYLQILTKLHDMTHQTDLDLLQVKFKSKIERYSKSITFFLKEKIVFHGQIQDYEKSGTGHLKNYNECSEYYGRIKGQKPSGKGLKWQGDDYSLQGYFNEGKLCGFGQKTYTNGSFYRYA